MAAWIARAMMHRLDKAKAAKRNSTRLTVTWIRLWRTRSATQIHAIVRFSPKSWPERIRTTQIA